MKAIVQHEYGAPQDVLQLAEVEMPAAGAEDVLVAVRASSANPWDWHFIRGEPVLLRPAGLGGVRKPKFPIPGGDLAGTVEQAGSAVTAFRPGDEVYGFGHGAFAEYIAVPQGSLAPKPGNLTLEQAAAVPLAAVTALQCLCAGGIGPGQQVLVIGASGGVGTFAVQIAKSYGADVTAVCSAGKLDQARSIGADRVIDYTKEDFTKNGEQYDLICDVAFSRSARAFGRSLKPEGICVVVGFAPGSHSPLDVMKELMASGEKRVGFMGMAEVNSRDLTFLAGLLEAKKVVPVIERRYPLAETAEAVKYLQEGHARGKVVVVVG